MKAIKSRNGTCTSDSGGERGESLTKLPQPDLGSEATVPQPQNKQFYPALDGFRACAVLMVFAQHYILSMMNGLWQWGWAGVDFFFVLSGFLITGILFDTRESTHRFRNFYIRRTLRIFPLYYGVLLVLFVLTPLLHWDWNVTWIYWPFYLENYVRFIYVHAFAQSGGQLESLTSTVVFLDRPIRLYLGHFWSLGVEEQFYLVWPFVVFAVKDRVKLRNICLAVVIAMPLIRLVVALRLSSVFQSMEFFYRLTPFRLDALLLGGLLALVLRGPEKRHLKRFAPHVSRICILLLFAMPIVMPMVFHHPAERGPASPWMETFGFTVVDLLAASAIWYSLQNDSSLFKLFSLKPLRRLGQMSYGFYVFHDIPHVFYAAIAVALVPRYPILTLAVSVLVAFASTLALSYLSYRFFELPFLRLKDRFAPS
jgi:peptidoglycan/LPS O-acetylase OafA/YrhL